MSIVMVIKRNSEIEKNKWNSCTSFQNCEIGVFPLWSHSSHDLQLSHSLQLTHQNIRHDLFLLSKINNLQYEILIYFSKPIGWTILMPLKLVIRLFADGWRQMKDSIKVCLTLFFRPQTIGLRADTWMLVLQYHLTCGICMSNFHLKPRKCQLVNTVIQ